MLWNPRLYTVLKFDCWMPRSDANEAFPMQAQVEEAGIRTFCLCPYLEHAIFVCSFASRHYPKATK